MAAKLCPKCNGKTHIEYAHPSKLEKLYVCNAHGYNHPSTGEFA